MKTNTLLIAALAACGLVASVNAYVCSDGSIKRFSYQCPTTSVALASTSPTPTIAADCEYPDERIDCPEQTEKNLAAICQNRCPDKWSCPYCKINIYGNKALDCNCTK